MGRTTAIGFTPKIPEKKNVKNIICTIFLAISILSILVGKPLPTHRDSAD